MGKTLAEKILAKAAGLKEVAAGDIVWVSVDKALMDDILGPRVQIAEKMAELGAAVWDPGKVVVVSDHYTPPATIQQAEIVKFTRAWASEHGIEQYYEFVGPCHQIMVENGHILPGEIVLGTDSHTCMGGALGCFASGVGSTEMLGILVTGKTWLRVPETIKVRWRGELSPGVMAKDISLKTIQRIGHAGATYRSVEYTGETLRALEIDERLAIANMAVEMGAKVGLMEADDKVCRYLAAQGIRDGYEAFVADDDAAYARILDFDAAALTPQVACPHEVDHVRDAASLPEIILHQAYIGSCTGGRYHDLAAAAALLKGRKVSKGVRLLISPASQEIWKRAEREGILGVLADAGAVILSPTCGICVGLHSGMLAAGEVCLSSTNRNFIGRMGSKQAEIYLASPLTVAAGAIAGRIIDPRELLQ